MDNDPIPLHRTDALLPEDPGVFLRRARRSARRLHRLIEETLGDLEADPGISPEEATREDIAHAEAALDEFAEALASYAEALERLEAYAAREAQQARDRRRAARFN
jgi:hypothetical protein